MFNRPWLLSVGLVYGSMSPDNIKSGVSTWILICVSCVLFGTPVDGIFSMWLKQNLSEMLSGTKRRKYSRAQ